MKQDCAHIATYLKLPQDTSLENMVKHIELKQTQSSNNLELAFVYAELLLRLGRKKEAKTAYHAVKQLSIAHSDSRYNNLYRSIDNKQKRHQIILFMCLGSFLILLSIGLFYAMYTTPSSKIIPGKDLALVRWLAQQQALELAQMIQKKYPHLEVGQILKGSTRSPWSTVQSYMRMKNRSNRQELGKKGLSGKSSLSKNAGKQKTSVLPENVECGYPLKCPTVNIKTRNNQLEYRLYNLLWTIQSTTLHKRDCDTYVKFQSYYEQEFGWGEDKNMGFDKDMLCDCYLRNKEYEQTIVHAENVICAGFAPLVLSGYNKLSFAYANLGNMNNAHLTHQCAINFAEHLAETTSGVQLNNIAHAFCEIANYKLYLYPLESLPFYRQALILLEKVPNKYIDLKLINQTNIQLPLYSAQIAARSPISETEKTYKKIIENSAITDIDLYKLQSLQTIYLLQQNNYHVAEISNKNTMKRLEQVDSYNCQYKKNWEWDKYLQTLIKSSPPEEKHLHAPYKKIISALDCEERTKAERMEILRSVDQWIKEQMSFQGN
jgi:hypothetical protein